MDRLFTYYLHKLLETVQFFWHTLYTCSCIWLIIQHRQLFISKRVKSVYAPINTIKHHKITIGPRPKSVYLVTITVLLAYIFISSSRILHTVTEYVSYAHSLLSSMPTSSKSTQGCLRDSLADCN